MSYAHIVYIEMCVCVGAGCDIVGLVRISSLD